MCYRLRVMLATSVGLLAWIASPVYGQVPAGSLKGSLLELGRQAQDPLIGEQVSALATLVGLEVSTAPLGTSTGGFTFTYDNQLGTFVRSSRSFGPLFAERSLTAGKGKFSAGSSWLHTKYRSLGGMSLGNGDLRTLRNGHSPLNPTSYNTLRMSLTSDTVVTFASIGITNNLDIGIAVPLVRISMDADVAAFTSSGLDLTAGNHGIIPRSATSGVGDVAILGNNHFWHKDEGGLAGQIEVRLPTGDTNNLRGLGVTRTHVSGIWSKGGAVAPHVNVGYEVWSKSVDIAPSRDVFAKNQIRYAAGVEMSPHPRTTCTP